MKKRKEYRKALEQCDFKTVNKIRQEFVFSEYSFHALVKRMQQHFKCHIDSNTAQKIATNLWKVYEKVFYGTGKRIRFKEGQLEWFKLKIPVKVRKDYEIEALKREIAYCRLVRDGRYYLQIVFKGKKRQ